MSEDGCLEHLGRKDFRAKIRGFTVEVAEIERALLEHPSIQEAVVVPTADTEGDNRLIGYVVVETTTPAMRERRPTASELRSFVKTKLPEYMIPSVFVFMERLPLTSNGKIDRRALPLPGQSAPNTSTAYVAPLTPIERQIAEVWAEVLKLDNIGIHDNFFDLGGHSLMAMQLVSKLRERLHVELSVRSFFEAPTVTELGRLIEAIRVIGQAQQAPIDVEEEREQGDL
jgi:acyl carrier protein